VVQSRALKIGYLS